MDVGLLCFRVKPAFVSFWGAPSSLDIHKRVGGVKRYEEYGCGRFWSLRGIFQLLLPGTRHIIPILILEGCLRRNWDSVYYIVPPCSSCTLDGVYRRVVWL